MSEKLISGEMPVLALRGLTVFPDQTVHFDIGRSKSIKALETVFPQLAQTFFPKIGELPPATSLISSSATEMFSLRIFLSSIKKYTSK